MNEETATELDFWASHFATFATESYPEDVFPPPVIGEVFTPDAYAAAGYRNAYRNVARSLRKRAAELRDEEKSQAVQGLLDAVEIARADLSKDAR